MGKKVVRIEIVTEEDDTRECFCLSGEKAHQEVSKLNNANSYASIDDMLKKYEKVVVNHDIEAKEFWDH